MPGGLSPALRHAFGLGAVTALALAVDVAAAQVPQRSYNAVANEPAEIARAMPEGKPELSAREVARVLATARNGAPVDLSNLSLRYLDLAGLDLKGLRLANADVWGVDFSEADLTGVDLSNARLNRASITRANFSKANLSGATLLRPTVHTSFQYEFKDAPRFTGANLKGLRVMGRLDGSDFRGADLTGADFSAYEPRPGQGTQTTRSGSDLLGCDFSGARLAGVNFINANLTFSRFPGADLRGALLADADLTNVDFSGADLTGADLSGANLYGATLAGVRGLDTVKGMERTVNLDKAKR